ncbi:MAG TPA: MBL fold metallo-hydrolase [Fibrobacteria bacterium]|nr:MBL fold metallo-hydrolase [Fibrobacteria bacterium]
MKTTFGKKARGLRLERMKASPLWADGAFRNVHPVRPDLKMPVTMPIIKDFFCGGIRRVPAAPLPAFDPLEPWKKKAETGLRATWLGHSTVLIEMDGFRVLTDPVWGERASPLPIAGPKRFQPVPVPISGLPPLDAVIISHDHYDHLDFPTILAMAGLKVPFITSLGVGAHLQSWGIPAERIIELDWWEGWKAPGGDLEVTAAPSQHFSGRTIGGRNDTLWSSFSVRGARHAFFFSGDTGLTDEYAAIRRRLGPFDLVMLEVGAYHQAWGDIHLGPENALEALSLLGGGSFLPVHWGTFNLAMHAWDDPAETLIRLAPSRGTHLVMPRLGEPVEPSRSEKVAPWWRGVEAAAGRNAAVPEPEEPIPEEAAKTIPWPLD